MIKTILKITFLLWSFSLLAVDKTHISEDDIYRTPSLFSVKLSPKEKFYSYVISKANTYELRVHSIENNKIAPLVFEKTEASRISEYTWLDSNTIYVSYKLKNGQTLEKLITLNFTDKFNIKINTIKADGLIIDPYSEKENRVLYALKDGRSSLKLYDISHDDLITGNIKDKDQFQYQLDEANFYWSSGGVLAALVIDDDEWEYHELDHETGNWEFVFTDDIYDYDFHPIGRLANGNLAVLSNYDSNVKSLYEFDLQTKEFSKLLYQHEKYDLVNAELDPKTKEVRVVHYYDHGRYVSDYFNNQDKDVYIAIQSAMPKKQIAITSSNSVNYYIVGTFSSTDRGAYYLFNNKNKELRAIGAIQEELEKYKLVPTLVQKFKAADGAEIESYYTKPAQGNGVLLVMPHGGPIGVREYDSFDSDVQYLASRGFAILQVNFRGSEGFGKAFKQQGVGEFGKLIESDISTVVNKVLSRESFKSICAIGASYGAYSSLMLAKKYPELYDCVIARFGIYDLPLLFSSSNLYLVPENRKRIERAVGPNSEKLFDNSPLYFLEGINAPILLTAGEKDEVAYFEHSKRLKYRLEQLKADFEYIFYKNAGHGHSNWTGDQHEMSSIYDFLIRRLNLKDDEPEALGSSYAKMADGFNNKYMMDVQEKKAFEYYKKAQAVNHPRSVFNVGSYYHRGKFVDYNLESAIDYYKKSSELGYSSAAYRLANIYFDGVYVDKDFDLAFKYYKKSEQQGELYASLDLAKFHCMGIVVERNLAKCMKAFDIKIQKDETPYQFERRQKHRDNIVRETLIDINMDENSYLAFRAYLGDKYNIKEYAPEATVYDWGIFVAGKHDETTDVIPIKENLSFGVNLELSANSENVRFSDRSILLVKWTTPKLKTKEGVPINRVQSEIRLSEIGKYTKFFYTLNREWELVEGDWKIEVFDLRKNLVFEKTFKTVKASNF